MTLSITPSFRALLPVAASLVAAGQLLAQPAGQPPSSGREPGTQGEKDWLDNRWSRTDVGPFLASILDTPGAWSELADWLTLRLPLKDRASIAFAALRALPPEPRCMVADAAFVPDDVETYGTSEATR